MLALPLENTGWLNALKMPSISEVVVGSALIFITWVAYRNSDEPQHRFSPTLCSVGLLIILGLLLLYFLGNLGAALTEGAAVRLDLGTSRVFVAGLMLSIGGCWKNPNAPRQEPTASS